MTRRGAYPGGVSTALDVSPAPAAGNAGGDDVIRHLVCCDDDVAMCGEDLAGVAWDLTCRPELDCALCVLVAAEGMPCPAAGCSLFTGYR